MKNKILLIIYFFSHSLIAQNNISCSGKIIDKNSQNPIVGVAIKLEDNLICYSDDDGNFMFETDKANYNRVITFSHVSYMTLGTSVSVFENGNQKITMSESTIVLNEVIIGTKSNSTLQPIKTILKNARLEYQKNSRAAPYWSEINYKQTVFVEGVAKGYYECDGYIFMPGQNKSPWIRPMTIPNQVRKINEDTELLRLDFYAKDGRSTNSKYVGSTFLNYLWQKYRFFEILHPLGNRVERAYNFKMNDIAYQDNSDCYIIQFQQKYSVTIHGWKIRFMTGKLWINKKDFTLKKIESSFAFDKESFNHYNVDYTVINSKLYPSLVDVSSFMYHSHRKNIPNLVKSATVTFNIINVLERENYSEKFGQYFITGMNEKYDKKYWSKHELKDKYYKNNVMKILGNNDWEDTFQKASQEKQYDEDSAFLEKYNYFEKRNLELELILKKDLNLK